MRRSRASFSVLALLHERQGRLDRARTAGVKIMIVVRSRSPDEIFARGGYGAKGSGGFLPARLSLSHCFHSGVW